MIAYLRAVYAANHLPQTAALLALSKWQTSQLIVRHQFRSTAQKAALKDSWFGDWAGSSSCTAFTLKIGTSCAEIQG